METEAAGSPTSRDSHMDLDALFRRYQELQRYVGWADADAERVRSIAAIVKPHLPALVDDFYAEIDRHPDARKVITGGQAQIERLKGTLIVWLTQLVEGKYDAEYVGRRWRVGWRHVEIGLDQVYTNVALSRLRRGLLTVLEQNWKGDLTELWPLRRSLNTLLDLDLAIIEDAYQEEYTARKQQVERARGDSNLRSLVEAAPCMIVILRPDHSIAYFSPFAEQVTGYHAAEVLGKDYFPIFLPAELRPAIADETLRVLAGHPSRGYENPVLCKDGTCRWIVWNAQALPDYEGGPATLAVGQDITKFKESQERALQSERLAAIGQMVAGLAHESGNALARSQACLEMLSLEVEDRPEALELIGRIQKAQDHLRQLYEEVRGYAAPLRLERETYDIAAIWQRAWDNLAMHRQQRNAHLRSHPDDVNRQVSVDLFRIEQVFRNIMENALAACKDPVQIDISCADTTLNGRPALRVSIRDNGPGLTPEQRHKIFEPFFTTKTKGTGLGMAIVKRIMEAHGGTIGVGEGTPGGAEIILTLPRETA
jgi:two-component system, LuxR family, sensor kinase FixL